MMFTSVVRFVIICSLLIVYTSADTGDIDFTSFLKVCDLKSVNDIEKCIVNNLDKIRHIFYDGAPELNFKSIEPVELGELTINDSSSEHLQFYARFKDYKIKGLSEAQLKNIKINYEDSTIYFELSTEELKCDTKYSMDGNVLFIPVNGAGTAWVVLGDVSLPVNATFHVTDDRLHFTITNFQYNYETAKLRLNSLFQKDPILGEAVNAFLNENSKEILDTLKPQVVDRFNPPMSALLNEIFSTIPISMIPGKHFIKTTK